MALLRHLHAWGAAWAPQEPRPAPDAALLAPDPRSTVHAVLQLLARLTKKHAIAEMVSPAISCPT